MLLYVLYEHAAGYTLFRCKEFEEVGMFLPQVESSVTDVTKFKSILQLVGFYPFKTAANALDNINSISEGVVHEDLQLFLETNLPKSGKKSKFSLGVSDTKIGASISELLTVKCLHTGVVPELIRGIRCHFASFVKGFSEQSSGKAQLGLGHSYSRSKVKFNVHRVDNMIIQSISLLDQLDKDVNTFSMRIREWYSYHFPELIKVVPENLMYAKVVRFIKNRKELTEEKLAGLEEIVMDEAKCRAIYDASKMSMGMDISPIDLINIDSFANRVVSLSEYRKKLQDYLKSKMNSVAPNLASLIGDQVGARLISRAGSLTNLAKFPASTVQILGAEKALFRALKTRGNTPKYGLIFHSSFIGRAAAQNKGRISRCLANKCSIASRIDCFTETLSSVFGEKLKEQVEERLRFYETGDVPRKNTVVMKEAIEKALVEKKRMKKEKRKRRLELEKKSMEEGNGNLEEEEEEKEPAEKKKKKKAKRKSSNSFNNSFSNGK